MSVADVIYEIGATGQSEKIRRGEVHANSLHEIQYIQLPTVFMSPLDNWQEPVEDQAIRYRLQIRGALQIRLGIDVRDHPFLHRVWLVFQHGDQIRSAIIHKGVKVESVLLEAADVYGP